MSIYYLLFFITIFIQFAVSAKNDKEYLRRTIITFIPLFLFGALRVDFGYDYPTYEAEFHLAHSSQNLWDISEHSETGYVILERIVPTWRLLIILTSALTCISYIFVFYKCIPPKYSWLAIFLLFLAGDKTIFFQFSGIRNAIVIAIMYLSFSLIRDRKWILLGLLTALGTTIHTSAILFIPIVFLICTNKEMTKREAWIWIISMVVLQAVSLNAVFDQVINVVGLYLDRYSAYAEFAEEIGDNRTFLLRSFCAVFVVLIVYCMRHTKLNKEENVICRMALIFVFSFLLGSLNLRMPQFFGFAFVAGSTIVVSKWRDEFLRLGYLSLTILFLAYSFFIAYVLQPGFPYRVYHSILE